jgi:hypothetical protein
VIDLLWLIRALRLIRGSIVHRINRRTRINHHLPRRNVRIVHVRTTGRAGVPPRGLPRGARPGTAEAGLTGHHASRGCQRISHPARKRGDAVTALRFRLLRT